jgi:hypothetical protein
MEILLDSNKNIMEVGNTRIKNKHVINIYHLNSFPQSTEAGLYTLNWEGGGN